MSLILKDVSYKYDAGTSFEVIALSDISFSIAPGSFVGITGKTGSGKSTLALIMAGLLEPSSGTVLREDRVGMVMQYPENQLFEESVIKDIMFGPLNQKLSDSQAVEKARNAMALMNLDRSLENRNPLRLSGGEKRRVAIAGVLAMEPDILILDEPCAGLDKQNHDSLFEVLNKLNENGKTIILISHDFDDVSAFCRETITLENGLLIKGDKN